MRELISWLKDNISQDDVVPGIAWVGNGRGTSNSDWHIFDIAALAEYACALDPQKPSWVSLRWLSALPL